MFSTFKTPQLALVLPVSLYQMLPRVKSYTTEQSNDLLRQ